VNSITQFSRRRRGRGTRAAHELTSGEDFRGSGKSIKDLILGGAFWVVGKKAGTRSPGGELEKIGGPVLGG